MEALGDSPSFVAKCGLLLVAGDPVSDEYVLYHKEGKVLACVDMFYGAYTDMDPCTTWLARSWFKFTRNGDYKSEVVLPSYRRAAVTRDGDVTTVRRSLGAMCDRLDFTMLVFSHGSPPCVVDAKTKLMKQWDW